MKNRNGFIIFVVHHVAHPRVQSILKSMHQYFCHQNRDLANDV